MDKNLTGKFIFILAVLAASIYFAFPLEKRINLGLDLKGGMHLIIKVKTEELPENTSSDAVSRAIEILRNRIDGLGVSEPDIRRQGENQILVQLPGITDRDAALAMIGTVAQLEFRLVNDNPMDLQATLSGKVKEGYILKVDKSNENAPILLEDKVAMSGEHIKDGRVDFDSAGFGQPFIAFTLDGKGTKIFGSVTQQNVDKRLAILLDSEVISSPRIQTAILSGEGRITGSFTFDEASRLALALRSGALPAPMEIEEERTIGPLLGRDSIDAGIQATVLGASLVVLFILIYYMKSGLIADLALIFNLLMLMGTMGLLNVLLPQSQMTLTLPGIAGIILTLGMAVDANVLINERIREEIANERPIQAAINNGFKKAFSAIFDSNFTTLIAAFMLFQFGSGPIKGFAVTLSIGLLTSLFTSFYVTKILFQLGLKAKLFNTLPMLKIFPKAHFDFLGMRLVCFTLSLAMILAGLVSLFNKKDTAFGIDFAGGQIQEYRFNKPITTQEVREALRQGGVAQAVIQRFEQNPTDTIVRTSEDTYDQVVKAFQDHLSDYTFEILRIEKVGPVVGKVLRQRALLAIFFALAGILIYVGFRFKHFDFAAAGVIALLHDVIVTLGWVVMLGREVDLLVVTALLTIAGYSINDTIVIYDRVRENMTRGLKMPLKELLNASINQTLGRTILTTLTTLLIVVTLYLKGGEVLNTFALSLIIGFVAGTYSTIYIASPLVLLMQKKGR